MLSPDPCVKETRGGCGDEDIKYRLGKRDRIPSLLQRASPLETIHSKLKMLVPEVQ